MGRDKRKEPELSDHYNPEKARQYRETFEQRNPLGLSWKEHIAAWRKEHPEYSKRSKNYSTKSRRIAKLNLKRRLRVWGLQSTRIQQILRVLSLEEIDRLVICLENWDVLTGCGVRTPERLLETVRQDDRALLLQVLEQVKRKQRK